MTKDSEDGVVWHKIYLGLGSNLGDRRANLVEAVSRLKAGGRLKVGAISRLYQTAPVGYADQPDFLNIAVEAETTFAPHELLSYLKRVEGEMGRHSTFRNGPRPIDIDILFYDDLFLDDDALTIPHPRLTERGFVLAPLADLVPGLLHPVKLQTVEELLDQLIEADGDDDRQASSEILPAGVKIYLDEPALTLPLPRFMFLTGRLAAVWLENYTQELGVRLGFAPEVVSLELDVAAFMTARYVVDKLHLEPDNWERLDALILPGFTGGDIATVEAVTKIRTCRGPNDLVEIEPFLNTLLGYLRPVETTVTYCTEEQLRQIHARLTDSNIRIYSDGQRVYAFNSAVFGVAEPEERDLRRLFRQLNISNAAHAYYLGRELNKAALSIKLGMRYRQDRELEPINIKPPATEKPVEL